jgi:superfamily II DNA/RNA helicase
MQSFADLGVSRAVVRALADQNVHEPFAVQRLVISDVLAGRDVLARSPTGSGKTLAFGIPLVDRIAADGPRPAALILAPTRELATQIAADIRAIAHARALRVAAVYGGVGLVKQARDAASSHIVVATPGRLEDLLARRAFKLDRVRVLVLDEADRMLDMGFRPAVERIVRACPPSRQTLFFSATLDGEAGRAAREYTADPVLHEHGPSARRAAAEVEHRFVRVRDEGRIEALISELEREPGRTLVFVRTKRGADRLVKRLGTRGVKAVAMHGNKSQRQRETALARFESGSIATLVATDVAARGIDVAGIAHVINFDPPADGEGYVHRVGRTGRAGRAGVATTLVGGREHADMGRVAAELGIDSGLHADNGRGTDSGLRTDSGRGTDSGLRTDSGRGTGSGRRTDSGRGGRHRAELNRQRPPAARARKGGRRRGGSRSRPV